MTASAFLASSIRAHYDIENDNIKFIRVRIIHTQRILISFQFTALTETISKLQLQSVNVFHGMHTRCVASARAINQVEIHITYFSNLIEFIYTSVAKLGIKTATI